MLNKAARLNSRISSLNASKIASSSARSFSQVLGSASDKADSKTVSYRNLTHLFFVIGVSKEYEPKFLLNLPFMKNVAQIIDLSTLH